MSWEQVASPHLQHKAFLRTPWELRCSDCGVTLLIHKEAGAPTPQPPRWKRPDTPPASPELIAQRKREVAAALAAARERRTAGEAS